MAPMIDEEALGLRSMPPVNIQVASWVVQADEALHVNPHYVQHKFKRSVHWVLQFIYIFANDHKYKILSYSDTRHKLIGYSNYNSETATSETNMKMHRPKYLTRVFLNDIL